MTHEELGWHQILGEIRRERLKLAYLTETCARCRNDMASRDMTYVGLLQLYPPDHDADCPIGLAQSTRAKTLRREWQEIMDAKTVARYQRPVTRRRFGRCARCGGRHAPAWFPHRPGVPSCEEKEKRRSE